MQSQLRVFVEPVSEHMAGAVARVPPSATCAEAVAAMTGAGATQVVVTGPDDRPLGILTERDVCHRVAFRAEAGAPVTDVMSTPVHTIEAAAPLYHAIARMHQLALRHLPVVDSGGRVVGTLRLDTALTAASRATIERIDRLARDATVEGLATAKAEQVEVAADLLDDEVPATDIQGFLSTLNAELYRRAVALSLDAMRAAGRGEPPVAFDVIVMGSGGRRESYLFPDQDNGFVLADYPDEAHGEIDAWFVELAGHVVDSLARIGFERCRGHVMATNPLWRKTVSQWRAQVGRWLARSQGVALRMCDIFFDFEPVHGEGALAAELRDFVARGAPHPHFLREMFRLDEEHGVALGLFGRLQVDREPGPHRGEVNLKLTGTLPLVGAVRILALRERVRETSTLARIERLHEQRVLDDDEHDYLRGAFRLIASLLLRQQLADHRAGRPVGNHVPVDALTRREHDQLVDALRAIRRFRSRVRAEVTAEVF